MKLTLIDKDMLRTAIAGNTDASEKDAAHIINTVLLKQRRHHGGECERDRYARDVCEGMYAEKCDDVIGLCEALRAVLALAGEHPTGPHPMHAPCAWHQSKTQGMMK